MIDFYFAGNHHERIANFVRATNSNALCSYINDIKPIENFYFKFKQEGWKGKLLIDNGAFTMHRNGSKIDIDEYINWLNVNDEYIDYAIALDEIPDTFGKFNHANEIEWCANKTYENFIYMRERVKSPNKLLPVFHQGDDFKWLSKYLDIEGLTYMCISANKTHTSNRMRENFYSDCYAIIKHSSNPNIKIHCLGSATIQNAEKFPFTSMDATTHVKYAIYGWIMTKYGLLYVGDNYAEISKDNNNLDTLRCLCAEYGMDFDKLGNDWLERTIFNAHYVRSVTDKVECERTSFNVVRRLF